MKIFNLNIGIGNKIKNKIVQISRPSFKPTLEWFEKLYLKLYTPDIASKFDRDLYVDNNSNQDVLESIIHRSENEILVTYIKKTLNRIEKYLENFGRIIDSLTDENGESTENKNQISLFIDFKTKLPNVINQLESVLTTIENKNYYLIGVNQIEFEDFNFSPDDFYELIWMIKPLDELVGSQKRLQNTLVQEEIYGTVPQIMNLIRSVNATILKTQKNICIIHGNAGVGKSNFSAFLLESLKENNYPVIFLKATQFSGESTDFESIFLKLLEVPWGYNLYDVLDLLNNYGKNFNKRITIIIDGLNETTFTNQGFSSIWKNHLNEFLYSIENQPYLTGVVTLRTSYIERIWGRAIPYENIELSGFSNENLEKVISKYFKYYKIEAKQLHKSDIFYFRTPLLLDLYCKMINPKREKIVKAILGFNGFKSVFENYIVSLSEEIRDKLDLISKDLVIRGLNSCSEKFVENNQAFINIIDYYKCMDGDKVKNVNNTIGYSVLEEYLIYIKDSINNDDVIIHTQQEVGGYLLSKYLLRQHGSIEEVVKSDFFDKNILGDETQLHQLSEDILKFMIVESEERQDLLTKYSKHEKIKNLVWVKLQREPISDGNIKFRDDILKDFNTTDDIKIVINNSLNSLLLIDSTLNIQFLKTVLINLRSFEFDLVWSSAVYNNKPSLEEITQGFTHSILLKKRNPVTQEQMLLNLELSIWLLESTIVNIRDKATHFLLEYGTEYPKYIFEKLIEFSTTDKLYIFERLAGIAYGICLRKQNDDKFIDGIFKEYVPIFYKLQFDPNPISPAYHYIVIDSLKHIIDLALWEKVFILNRKSIEYLQKYKFSTKQEWDKETKTEMEQVIGIVHSWHNKEPDPLGKDFVTYTIPRLLKHDETNITEHIATANIYKRAISYGYIPEEKFNPENELEKYFYYGTSERYGEGKIERLGKKYSWNAFFEYAGYLLRIGELDCKYEDDELTSGHYKRLSDVVLEVSFPMQMESKPLPFEDLFKHKTDNPDWTKREVFDFSKSVWKYMFKEGEFTLLYGYASQHIEDYKIRSYILIEPFLVKKDDIYKHKHLISDKTFEWSKNIHDYAITLSKVYFGELFWADTVPDMKFYEHYFGTGEFEEIERELDLREILLDDQFPDKKPGDIIKEKREKTIAVNVMSGAISYSWESTSKIYPSFTCHIPTPNIGKSLSLRADSANCDILDSNGIRAVYSTNINEKNREQDFMHLRTDLLRTYLEKNNLILLYQIKQHTYDRITGDGTGDFRGMRFIFPDV